MNLGPSVTIPDSPLQVFEINDAAHDLRGFVVIHSSFTHRGRGGVRIYPDVTRREVELLARGMTYKYCFHNIAIGGAKGGICLTDDLSPEQRRAQLRRFGSHIRSLIRTEAFMPSTDMNCSAEDVLEMYRGAGVEHTRVRRGTSDAFSSGDYTALSTMAGIVAAARHLGIEPPECSVTIEGLGSVGRRLASEIDRWGGKVVGVSNRFGGIANPNGLDVAKLLDFSSRDTNWPVETSGKWESIATRDLFELPMTIHVPGARVQSIDEEVAGMLKCAAVVPAANVPCSPDGSRLLGERGILLLPHFVTNSGGITSFRLRLGGLPQEAIRRFFERDFTDMLSRMLITAEGSGRTPEDVAREVSVANYRTLSARSNHAAGDAPDAPPGRQHGGSARTPRFLSWRRSSPVEQPTDNIPATTAAYFR